MEDKTIQIRDIQLVCNRIFNFILEDLQISSIELDANLYWNLPSEVRYEMTVTPNVEYVGSLMDDYDFVKSAVKDADQALPLLFQHIAPLLEALATKVRNYP